MGYAENAVIGSGHLDPGMHVMTKPFAHGSPRNTHPDAHQHAMTGLYRSGPVSMGGR